MSISKKPRPSIKKMREDVTRFEIEEVFYSKDYKVLVEDGDIPEDEAWQSEEEIVEFYKGEDDEEIEFIWEEWFNQSGDYEEKDNDEDLERMIDEKEKEIENMYKDFGGEG